jgi:DNA-binding beta-propeller fold protein YncE
VLGRRRVLKAAAGLAASALGAGVAPSGAQEPPQASPVAAASPPATPPAGGLVGYAFNAKTQDVTLFDPATRRVLATKPLGAVVRWLSNEQRFWDGRHVWTYDFPDDRVRAIAVDPRAVGVARALPTGGAGPAHSLMLTPDRTEAWVNVAGGDRLAVLDLASGEVAAEVATGAFP